MKRRLITDSVNRTPLPTHSLTSKQRLKEKRRLGKQAIRLSIGFGLLVALILLAWEWIFRSGGMRVNLNHYYVPVPNQHITWDWPVLHIVNTRFMQEQGNLTSLAKARLALFEVFCLPTMAHQSTDKFLWIIKTDPNLDPEVLDALIEDLRPYPNFYLVASNTNFRINELFPGAWRDGAEVEDISRSRVYTGDQRILENAMGLVNPNDPYPLLETRLDSDDGLHLAYLEAIQRDALQTLRIQATSGNEPRASWMYWCARRHIEWHFAEDFQEDTPIWKHITTYGAFQGIQHSNLCITPGITVGFGHGTAEKDVPIYAHQVLRDEISEMSESEACGLPDHNDCLQFVAGFIFEAVRSRSPTSAGMLKIDVDINEVATDPWLYYEFANMLRLKFGIPLQHLKWVNMFISENLLGIAEDNFKGQCTTGHSCKEKARDSLLKFIASRKNITFLEANAYMVGKV